MRTLTLGFNLGKSQSGRLNGNTKEKGLDVTLDDSAVQYMRISLGE